MAPTDPPAAESAPAASLPVAPRTRRSRATQFLLRGLAITLPPILTLVILIWLGQIIYAYVINPISLGVRHTIAYFVDESQPTARLARPEDDFPPLDYVERRYRLTPELHAAIAAAEPGMRQAILRSSEDGIFVPFNSASVPYRDYRRVAENRPPHDLPNTARGVYVELVTIRYFGNLFLLSAVAVSLVVVALYFLGGLVTARIGSWAVNKVESVFVQRVPIVSNVYSSVKQVTDFFLTERTVSYNRVVAFEYPRRGLWTIAFVTSDSLLDITVAAREPLVTVLVPTSPMPMTGFTVSVPRSELVDLDLTMDQVFQYCLSCGVLVPPHQRVTPEKLQREFTRRFAAAVGTIDSKQGAQAPGGSVPSSGSNGEPDSADDASPERGGPSSPEPEPDTNRRGLT